jgi:hypothetical protein
MMSSEFLYEAKLEEDNKRMGDQLEKLKAATENLLNTAVERGIKIGGDYFTGLVVEEAAVENVRKVLNEMA